MKCLIIDKMHESILEMLPPIGINVDYQPNISRDEILTIIHEYEGLLIRSKTAIDQELIEKAKQLVFVGRAGAGVDQIDTEALQAKDIKLLNAPEGNRDALAEHAVGMLLAIMNKLHTADRDVRQFIWKREDNRGYELMGKTVGVIGYGYMGQAFVQRLKGFGCKILVYDKYKTGFSDQLVKEVKPEVIYEQADIVSLHIPLTEETRSWVDDQWIKNFNKDIFFLNTARGEIMDLQAIIDHLKGGKLKGAALDVLPIEKFDQLSEQMKQAYQQLFELSNVLLTPHVGGWTHESYRKINESLVTKIKILLASKNSR